MPVIENCTAVILTGGESRRMGRDKALVEWHGKTMLQHGVDGLAPLFAETMVSVHMLRPELGLPQVVDTFDGRGPMVGIASALRRIETEWLFVAGCDMPYLAMELVRHMAAQRQGYDAVLAELGGYIQPMPGFYAREACLPAMQRCLEQGYRSLIRLMPSLNTALLPEHDVRQFDTDLRSFTDFDTPELLASCSRP